MVHLQPCRTASFAWPCRGGTIGGMQPSCAPCVEATCLLHDQQLTLHLINCTFLAPALGVFQEVLYARPLIPAGLYHQ